MNHVTKYRAMEVISPPCEYTHLIANIFMCKSSPTLPSVNHKLNPLSAHPLPASGGGGGLAPATEGYTDSRAGSSSPDSANDLLRRFIMSDGGRDILSASVSKETYSRKVFIGGLPPDVDEGTCSIIIHILPLVPHCGQ